MKKVLWCLLALMVLAGASQAQTTDLGIVKATGVTNVAPGSVLVYTLVVTNHHPSEVVSDFVIRDTVPGQTTFLPLQSLAGWTCDTPDEGGQCTFHVDGPLPPLQSFSVRFAVQLDLSAAATVSNTATVVANAHLDTNPSNNSSTILTPVGAGSDPNLFVAKSTSVANARPNDVVVYSIAYGNLGNQSSAGAFLTEIVPTGTTFDAASSDARWVCSNGGGEGESCTLFLGGLSGGGIGGGMVDFAVRVNEPVPSGTEEISNRVFVADDGTGGPDTDPSDNTSLATVPLDADVAPDLRVTASADIDPVDAGATLTYSLALSNVGTQDASGVALDVVIPVHATFLAAGSSAFSCPSGAGGETCTLTVGDLAGSGGASGATFRVVVADPLASGVSALAMTAMVADDGSSGPDLNIADNTTTVVVGIDSTSTAPDLVLGASADGATVNAGDQIIYTLPYRNEGSQGASGVELEVTLPADATFVAAGSSAFSCAGSGCTLDLNTLGGGGAAGTATLIVQVSDPVGGGVTSIDLSATLGDDGASGADQNPADNTAAVSTSLEAGSGGTDPDLVLTAIADVTSANAGDAIRFTFGYRNDGPQSASGVTLTVPVPADASFTAAGSAPFVCAFGNCVLTIGDLAGSGGSGSADLVVTVDDPLGAGVTSIDALGDLQDDGASGADQNPSDNAASASVLIETGPGGTAPDLTIQKSDAGVTADAGDVITYTLTFANNGPQDASGVRLTEIVPANTSFVSVGSPGFLCQSTGDPGDICTLTVGALAGRGGSGSETFSVRVDAGLPASVVSILNTVEIGDDGAGGADQNPLNNTASEATPIASTTAADMAIEKSDGGVTAVLGGELLYTLTVRNLGTREAVNVILDEVVPDFTSFDPAASDGGWACSGSGCSLTLGNFDPGEEQTILFGVRVAPSLPGGVSQIINGVAVSHTGADLDTGNDSAMEITLLDTSDVPDLMIAIDDGDVTVDAGDSVTYTMDWRNDGSRDTAGVLVTVLFPSSEMSVDLGASTPGFSCGLASCTFDLGDVVAGDLGSLSLVFTITDPVGAGVEVVDLQATISDAGLSGPDGNPIDNTDSVTTEIGTNGGDGTAPNLWVVKTVKSATVARGDVAIFDLEAGNAGNQQEAAAMLMERVPENTVFSAASSTKGWDCDSGTPGTECFFDLGESQVGTSETVVFAVEVGEELRDRMVNIVTVAGSEDDQDDRDNRSLALFGVGWVDLEVSSQGLPLTVTPGQSFTYPIEMRSVGTVDPSVARLTIEVGPNVTLDGNANRAEGWDCSIVAQTIFDCALPVSGAWSGPRFGNLHLVAGSNAGGLIALDVRIADLSLEWGPDPTPENNMLEWTTVIGGEAAATDLGVEATDGGVVPGGFEAFSYYISVGNYGQGVAADTVVSFDVPFYTFYDTTVGGWECSLVSGTAPRSTCTRDLGDLEPGVLLEVEAPLRVVRLLPADVLEVFFEVEVSHAGLELNPGNNNVQLTTTIDP